MAAVDALLQLLVAEGADALTLAGGSVPELSKAGEARLLSMPPLARETLARFVDEIRTLGDDGRYKLNSKGTEVAFNVAIDGDDRIEFRIVGGAARAATGALDGLAGGMPGDHVEAGAPDAAPAPSPDGLARDLAGNPAGHHAPHVTDDAGVQMAEQLVARAFAADATDLFISSAADARLRVAGVLHELAGTRCAPQTILALAHLDEAQCRQLEGHGSVDVSLVLSGGRVRANVFRHHGGLSAAIRPVRPVRSLADLGLPADLGALTEYGDGLVLMVGPAGSGKSTTLAALIDHLNRTRACHIVTVEDPIEFEYEHDRCLVHQREVGRQVESFAAGLRAALRESPDVILVGEMRDPETIAAALTAAETGHLVLSTLHSGSPAMAVDRIIDAFPPHRQDQVRLQLAGALRAVLTLALLPGTRDGSLVVAVEKMVVTHAVAHSIRESRGHHIETHIQTGRADGMVSLEMSLAELVRKRKVSLATATAAARNTDVLHKLVRS